MNIIKKFLSFNKDDDKPISKFKKIQIASCALLLETAKADGEFSDEEKGHIVEILKSKFNLSVDEVHGLIETSNLEIEKSLDLWQFTNSINKNFSRDEKMEMIELIWQVVYVDQKLDKHEDYLMHKFQDLLNLDHKDLINAKMKVKGEIN